MSNANINDLLSQAVGAAGFDVNSTMADLMSQAANTPGDNEALAKTIKSSPTLQPLLGGSGGGAAGAAASAHHHQNPNLIPVGGGGNASDRAINPNLTVGGAVSSSSVPGGSSPSGGMMPLPDFASEANTTNAAGTSGGAYGAATAEPKEVPRSRRVELDPGTEYRILVDDKLYEPVTVRVLGNQEQTGRVDDPTKTAEVFGKEMVLEQEYCIMPGSRSGFFTWKGCSLQITGGTVQEFPAANPQMSSYANTAAVLERRRIRAIEVGAAAPRVMVTGSDGSGKSVLTEILWHYAIRRSRTPIFVEADPRFTASVSEPLKGLPGCIHAVIPQFLEEEEVKRLSFFFGLLNWADNASLYEQVVSRLATVVNKKLNMPIEAAAAVAGGTGGGGTNVNLTALDEKMGEDSKRVSQSGMILNAPAAPTVEILQCLVREFYIDTVLVLDDQLLSDKLKRAFETENVDVVYLEKTDGAFLEDAQTLRMQRHQRMREYFQGVSPVSTGFPIPGEELLMQTFHPLTAYHGSFPLHQINLLQYSTRLDYKTDMDGNIRSIPQLTTSVFDRSRLSELIHSALAVIRATSEEDLNYMQLAGYIIVTGIDQEQGILHVAMPDVPPLPSNYFLVPSDVRNMTFLDALSPVT